MSGGTTNEADHTDVGNFGSEGVAANEAPHETGERLRVQVLTRLLAWALACIFVPLGLFLLMRPDWYYKSNGLDPYFYTGYAQNLRDVIAVSGDRHYFVSRWTHYLPNWLFVKVFGAESGFLMLRWVATSLIAACVVALGKRRWRTPDIVALTIFTLISPMLLRAVLNDYIDSLTAPLGILSIVLVSLRPDKKSTAVVVGACAAAIGTANPTAGAIIICIIPAWFIAVKQWRTRLILAFIMAVSASVVVAFGLIFFRLQFDISNVYEPSIRFAREHTSLQDPLKSPRLWWMGYRLWIYIPLLVLLSWWYLVKKRAVVFDATERTILITCAVQYGFQIWFQFSRHGGTLELPYYWSMMVPSLVLGVIVVLGKIARSTHSALLPAAVGLLVAAVGLSTTSIPEVYSSWIDALILIAAAAAIWHRLAQRAQGFAVCAMVFIVFTLQAGAPRGEPTLPGERIIEASYETVYNSEDSPGVDAFHAATWFTEKMNSLDRSIERATYFWIGGANGHRLAAMYSAHVSGRWINPGWGATRSRLDLSKDFVWAVQTGVVNVIAMVGTADDIATMTTTLDQLRPGYEVILEGVAPDKVQTNIRVVSYGLP